MSTNYGAKNWFNDSKRRYFQVESQNFIPIVNIYYITWENLILNLIPHNGKNRMKYCLWVKANLLQIYGQKY